VARVAFQAEMGFQAEVQLVRVEEQRFLCSSSMSENSLLYQFGMEGSWPNDFYKPMLAVFPS
jgi:hypothetical protein